MGRELLELGRDLVESQTDSLREHDESDPAEDRPMIASLTSPCPIRRNQSALFIEAESRCGNAASAGYLANQKQVIHAVNLWQRGLDFKFT